MKFCLETPGQGWVPVAWEGGIRDEKGAPTPCSWHGNSFRGAYLVDGLRDAVASACPSHARTIPAARQRQEFALPYRALTCLKVRIKQQVLEEEVAKVRSAGGKRQTLGGGQWYSQQVGRRPLLFRTIRLNCPAFTCFLDAPAIQALRAVNQALGRVIRHRHDYGAILLCDERFAGHDVKNQLSKWLRDKVQEPKTFGVAAAHLQKFFRVCCGPTCRAALLFLLSSEVM